MDREKEHLLREARRDCEQEREKDAIMLGASASIIVAGILQGGQDGEPIPTPRDAAVTAVDYAEEVIREATARAAARHPMPESV